MPCLSPSSMYSQSCTSLPSPSLCSTLSSVSHDGWRTATPGCTTRSSLGWGNMVGITTGSGSGGLVFSAGGKIWTLGSLGGPSAGFSTFADSEKKKEEKKIIINYKTKNILKPIIIYASHEYSNPVANEIHVLVRSLLLPCLQLHTT